MNEREFLEAIQGALKKKFDKGTQIRLQEVRKNNNILLKGLFIQKPDSNISPTIYMNGFYEMYQKGYGMEEIVEHIIQIYYEGEVPGSIDMEFFRDFKQVKDRIVYRLINAEKNKELLKEIPHILFLDLAICFYYAFYSEALGEGIILIHNNHMEMWNTNHQELMSLAQENTPRLFKPMFITLDAIVHNMFVPEATELEPASLYVVTNRQKSQGAACILYPKLLEHIAGKLCGSYYMIPSSIHEVIIFKATGKEDIKYLQEIIQDANNSQLLVEDILSDHPYYYDKSEKKLVQKRAF